jgi:choline-sulfatase
MADAKNLLFIFSDQHARHVTGCYGDDVVETPNIDRLAAEGVTFDNACCPSPICVPSRMSMLTARWPHRNEVWTNDDVLSSAIPTWPHAMGAGGKRPVLVGRMHALGPDQLHGYAERQIGDHSPNYPGLSYQDYGPLAGTNNPDPRSLKASGPGRMLYEAKDEEVTDAAVRWIEEHAAAHAGDGGFCLTVGYMLPHAPYVADSALFAKYAGRVPPPRLGPPDDEHSFHAWWRENRGIAGVTPEEVDRARTAYWALVDELDTMIGRVLAALERTGLMDETLIVYTSDHGDHVGERGLFWKHTFFEESVAIPMVMRLPGVLPAGERRSEVVNLVDLSQTMLEAVGAPLLPNADGRSFWQVARGGAPWRSETFSEYCTDAVPYWTGGRAVHQRMIRDEAHKLVLFDDAPPLLFDLAADPLETRNLADEPKYAPVLERLRARVLQDWDPERVRDLRARRRADKDILAAWAAHVRPAETCRWTFEPGVNRLDDDGAA